MSCARVPDVYADGRWYTADEVDTMGRHWRAATLDAIGDRHRVIATALPATREGVALVAALSSLPWPLVVVAPDATAWPPVALPPDTHLVLLPSLAHLASAAQERGCIPFVLPQSGRRSGAPSLAPLSCPGLVMFTSGSTGAPKPVFRPTSALLDGQVTRAEAIGLKPGEGIIVGSTLIHGQGMNMLISAMLLGGPLGFLQPVNHRAAISTLAMPEFACWRATPHYADMLGRCPLTGPAMAPRICLLSSPTSNSVFDAFHERFGVPLRQAYASSETGPIAVDNRPAFAVRPGTVGPPLPRVEVRIGDHPSVPNQTGETGRVWVRSPWMQPGYGFPPDVERPEVVDGWWPTRDLASVQADGQLALAGRLDDCIRTRDGRLVNLAAVADTLRGLRTVRSVAVVPLPGTAGASFGALIECDGSVAMSTLRIQLSDVLPPWARPRRMAIVSSLPRLPNGKPDRQACVAALGGESS